MPIQIRKEGASPMENRKEWEIVFRGSLVAVERHVSKGFERAIRPPGVRLILKNEEGGILITKEFREEQGKYDYRLPGGKIFDDLESYLAARNDPDFLHLAVLRAGQLESKQEAGVDKVEGLSVFHKSVAGATVEWDLYYLTGIAVAMGAQDLDGDEKDYGIEVGFYTPEEVLAMLLSRQISEDRTAAALHLYLSDRI